MTHKFISTTAFVILAGTLASQNLSTGLIGWWPFDGNANDYSGYNNHGQVNGATLAPDRFNNANSAYYFDGNDFIDVLNAAILNPTAAISISAWYKTANFSGAGASPIIVKCHYTHTPPYYQYKLSACGNWYSGSSFAAFNCHLATNNNMNWAATNPGYWTVGNWYHLASVYNGSVLKLYVNGSLVSSTPVSGAIPTYSTDLRFGNNTTASDFLVGTVDDVRIYDRALSDAEVLNLYCGPAQPSAINGPTAACSSAIYSVPAAQGATSYSWTVSGGWSGNSTSNTISVSGSGTGTISVTAVNSCGNSAPTSMTVISSAPAAPGQIVGPVTVCSAGMFYVNPVPGVNSYSWTLPSGWTGTSTTNTIGVSNISGSGMISVSISNTCGSSPSSTIMVSGNTPTISILASTTSVCPGNMVQLMALGASFYSWSSGQLLPQIQVNPVMSGGYTVTGINSAGCSSSQSVFINVLPVPALTVTSSSEVVCRGDAVTFFAQGASSYYWYTGSQQSSIVLTPFVSGTVSVTGTAANGCTATSAYAFQVNLCTGLDAEKANPSLEIFPNPAHNVLFIRTSPPSHPLRMEIADLTGRVLLSRMVDESECAVSLSEFASGSYLVTIIEEGVRPRYAKFLKE